MKEFKVVLAKLKARIAMRGSNSFNLFEMALAISEILLHDIMYPVVEYTTDAVGKVSGKYKTIQKPGKLTTLDGERETCPGDGQMICSFKFAACMACIMRIITLNEYKLVKEALVNAATLDDLSERVKRIIKKIPSVFQIRHEGCKGIVVMYPLEFIDGVGADLIVPESARKFASCAWHEMALEVCNFLKKKSPWVALNPQFIASLDFDNPNALCPIVDYWAEKLQGSIDNFENAMEFHGILSTIDSENAEINSNLVTVMRNCRSLLDDFQIRNWRKKQYDKFLTDMKIGRIFVPGSYTYMVMDPAYMLNSIYGLDLPCFKSGQYWFNNVEAQAGLFRSPLIAQFEAQKVQLVQDDSLWFFQDIVVFNGYDGAWENMGGGDFDGDTCAVVPDNTDLGKIIVDAIHDPGYVVWEKGLTAQKETVTVDNLWHVLAEFNAKVAKVDRTGIITNYASRSLDIYRHLKAAVYFAKYNGCTSLYLEHPSQMPYDVKPHVAIMNGHKVFVIRGFCEAKFVEGNIEFSDDQITGEFSFDEIESIAQNFFDKVDYLRLMQGREIDSAKTGVAAEGLSGEDFVDEVKIRFTPHEMITRQGVLKRGNSKTTLINSYMSLSPLGRLHDYVEIKEKEITDKLLNGTDKCALLWSVLTDNEKNVINTKYRMSDGSLKNLIEICQGRKKEYGIKVSSIINSELSDEEQRQAFRSLKDSEAEILVSFANTLNIDTELIAVAAYIAAYAKGSHFDSGLSYGWLMFNDILSVFTRRNERFELYGLPDYAEEARIVNEVIFVNNLRYGVAEGAEDTDFLLIQEINGRKYATVHKKSKRVVKPVVQDVEIDRQFNLPVLYGFKFYSTGSVQGWKDVVINNQYRFDVDLDDNGRLIMSINQVAIGSIKTSTGDMSVNDLIGHTVQVICGSSPIEFTDNAIKNVTVKVVA